MTARSPVDVTVVVPTYNRRDRLRRVLEALDRQVTTTSNGRTFTFDVVVVSDGSTDGTVEMAESLETSYTLNVIQQQNSGPAAARNHGVEAAAGRIIIFIDDDVIPASGCIAAHIARHDETADLVVIGPMLTPEDFELSPWVAWEQHQLYKQYARFNEGEPAYARQFYTGNASLSRAAFQDQGGFDTSFRRAEDVELANRLNRRGQSFVFEPAAEAHHYAERSLDSWARIAFDYGRHDVDFARMDQPEIFGQIAWMFSERHLLQRALVLGTMWNTSLCRLAQDLMITSAALVRSIGLVGANRWFLSAAYGLGYYRGVSVGLGSSHAFYDLTRGRRPGRAFRAVFVLEQTLGHITHSKNLQSLLPNDDQFTAVFLPVDDSLDGIAGRIPGWSNWTVRAGIRARRSLRRLFRSDRNATVDAMFVHSQVPAILLGRWMSRIPTVVSLDATPLQYDELGEFYAHEVGSPHVERLKHWANRRCYSRARHLITWSEWAKRGLVDHYGVNASDVTVIAPGVDVDRWSVPERIGRDGPIRVLFVGGDLKRKGGDLLLEASRRLHADADVPEFEIHLVTSRSDVDEPGVVIHTGLTANSPELVEQYHLADIFCLPTSGDCLPMVLAEAGAAGLPLISTDVGAISELVRDGETGRLIRPGGSRRTGGCPGRLVDVSRPSARVRASSPSRSRARPRRSEERTSHRRCPSTCQGHGNGMTELRRQIDDGMAVARAHWHLRKISHIGKRVRLRGRPVINANGSIIVHDRVQLVSDVARLELGTGEGGVLEIGARSLINYGCSIAALDRVTIGERCLIGPHCMIIDSAFHDIDPDRRLDPPAADPIVIGNNVWLGARVIVLPGVTIGENSVIGVGSVVTHDIPANCLAFGVPAKMIRTL